MVLLVILLFAKKDYTFEKETLINAKSSEVYNFLKFLKNQPKFNHWYISNNDYTDNFTGEDGTASAIFRWESNNYYLRSGTQTIKKMNYPETIQIDIATDGPYNVKGAQFFRLTERNGATNLNWKITVRFPFPYNIIILSDNFEKRMDKSIEISFQNLRKELEK